MLGFRSDFEELLQQNPGVVAAKRAELVALHRKVRLSRESRAQKMAFLKLSFVLELLHYYENQSTESPDVIFAQRLPPLVEQLVVTGESGSISTKNSSSRRRRCWRSSSTPITARRWSTISARAAARRGRCGSC